MKHCNTDGSKQKTIGTSLDKADTLQIQVHRVDEGGVGKLGLVIAWFHHRSLLPEVMPALALPASLLVSAQFAFSPVDGSPFIEKLCHRIHKASNYSNESPSHHTRRTL
eukprot:IDg19187t1